MVGLTGVVGIVVRSRLGQRTDRVVRDAVLDIATATDREAITAAVDRAVRDLVPSRAPYETRLAVPPPPVAGSGPTQPSGLVPINAIHAGDDTPLGALLVDRVTASRSSLRPALQVISTQAAFALERLRLTEEVGRHRSERHFRALVEQTTDVVLIVDEQDRIRYASPSARTVFGTSALDDIPLPDLVDRAERRPAEFLLRHARAGDPGSPVDSSRADWTIQARDGRRVQVEVSCRRLPAEEPIGGVVVTMRDVTTQRHLEHELTRRVFHDPLTGLPNRLLFSERVGQAVATKAGPAGVLLIDLDNFKAINDGLGHDVGDTVLTVVGDRLRDAVGQEGLAARLGDDEFAGLIRDAIAEAPEEAAARVAESLAEPIPVGGGTVFCSASVGIATSAAANGVRELLQHAGLALGAAKAAGPGQWRQYEPSMSDGVVDRLALRAALSRAIQDDALTVDYQPIVALDTGHIVGFEALLRWQHPTRGLLRPDEFIDIAEDSGLIAPIGEWVLATAMNEAQRWKTTVPEDAPYVSVNVSAKQFRSVGFLDTVHRLLTATGLPAGRLVLEITESLLLRDDDSGWDDLQQLRLRGVRVAIDDFGTGYSALSYLRHAPLDVVKLDRLFISPLTSSTRQRELVAGIVRLARSLDLDVLAEGIETSHQRDLSFQIGCAYGQGYLFGRPVPNPEIYLPDPAGIPRAGPAPQQRGADGNGDRHR